MGDAIQFHLERNRDLLFDLFGSVTRPLRDDLRVGVGDVGICFDGQGMERDDAPDEEDERASQNKRRKKVPAVASQERPAMELCEGGTGRSAIGARNHTDGRWRRC
jgi:hypothetical protein